MSELPIWLPFSDMGGKIVHISIDQIESFKQVKYPPATANDTGIKTVITMVSGRQHDVPLSSHDFVQQMANALSQLANL